MTIPPVRFAILGLVLLAAVAGSFLTSGGPDGIFGALLAALMLAITVMNSAATSFPTN